MKQIYDKNYTLYESGYQLILPLNLTCIIPSDDKVRLLSQFVEELDLTDLYRTYERVRKSSATPKQMFKVVLYARMNRIYSSRDVESVCGRDINFMYLLEGSPAPDHSTIARFMYIHFEQLSEKYMAQMSEWLFEHGEISGHDIFIDGTKIESCANKYTFVWKKTVTKAVASLGLKAAALTEQCENLYGFKIVSKNTVSLHTLKRLRKKLYRIKKEEGIEFVHGAGRRKPSLQKSVEELEHYIDKLKEYTKKLHTCGDRNSYSKTDPDATFMRMKEDSMRKGQLKPGYNLQHGVDSEYIVWLTVGPQPADTTTLIPFIKSMESHLSFKYTNIVADAGYESEENYLFLEENGQLAFIKPSNYEISKTHRFKQDISRVENMDYDKEQDTYTCKEGKTLSLTGTSHQKTQSGYKREISIYTCSDCEGCSSKKSCIKGNHCKKTLDERFKTLNISKTFVRKREESLERIVSAEGCMLRMNRSIQAEGSFSGIKDGMEFRRYKSRGKRNVLAESILNAMARNLNKLHVKIQSGKTGTHLYELKST